uniref:Pathogenesis-related protein family 10-3.1 n=1 Tax=Pinus monticola TaxID=3345 RepID=A0A411J0S5_PINMO|nr:pathogenesis-related protein family 10-3.1 [Pinus monticola]
MVSGTATSEDFSEVEARRIWNALVKDSHNLLPKIFPDFFSSATVLQGDGGVGTIKETNFTPANKEFSYAKERIDEIDEEKMVIKYTTIEGGLLGKKLSASNFELKIVPKKEGGCVVSWICNYETLSGAPFDEGKAQEMKEQSNHMFKKIEQYLLSNSSLYC